MNTYLRGDLKSFFTCGNIVVEKEREINKKCMQNLRKWFMLGLFKTLTTIDITSIIDFLKSNLPLVICRDNNKIK